MTSAVKGHDVSRLDLGHNTLHCLDDAFPMMSILIIRSINGLKSRLMFNEIKQTVNFHCEKQTLNKNGTGSGSLARNHR